MTIFKTGQRSDKLKFTMKRPILVEDWCEIWRGEHDEWNRVFIIAYLEGQGHEIFEKSKPTLERWKHISTTTNQGFLPIYRIFPNPTAPIVIVKDPQGKTARQFFIEEDKIVVHSARMAISCVKILSHAKSQGLYPIGLCPETIVHNPEDKDYPWQIIPVLPGSVANENPFAEGRYVPPQTQQAAAPAGDPKDVWSHVDERDDMPFRPGGRNVDICALSWIWAEAVSRNFKLAHYPSELKESVPFPRMRMIIQNGVTPDQEGVYSSPDMTQMAINHWINSDAIKDKKDYEAGLAGEKSKKEKKNR